jgi:hypothetical protein
VGERDLAGHAHIVAADVGLIVLFVVGHFGRGRIRG